MPKVLIIAGDGVEAQEIFYPFWRLKEAALDVVVAAPSKKTLFTVVHDFEPGWETYTEKPATDSAGLTYPLRMSSRRNSMV